MLVPRPEWDDGLGQVMPMRDGGERIALAIGGFPLFALIFDVDFSKPGRGI
jgi:hypothetical protein